MSDVKELIPELFYCPEMLLDGQNLPLGTRHDGSRLGDVVLPPWAKGSAHRFVDLHRKALESDFVSDHLHGWVDLIFGSSQRGEAAGQAARRGASTALSGVPKCRRAAHSNLEARP